MKVNKSMLRTRVTDGHLDAVMRIANNAYCYFIVKAKFFNFGPMTCPTQRFFPRTNFLCMDLEM